MEHGVPAEELTPQAMESLRLPAAFDDAAFAAVLDIDAVLSQDEPSASELTAKVATHRQVALTQLWSGHHVIDLPSLGWPSFLYIPQGANALRYWIAPAPDDHRYAREWTSPVAATDTDTKASRHDGTLSSFSQLLNEAPRAAQSSEAGLGVLYRPPMTLGVIDLQPHVDCSGALRTLVEFFPQLAAGHVEVQAHLLLAAWHVIPGGFDLCSVWWAGSASSRRSPPTPVVRSRPSAAASSASGAR